MRLIFMGSPKFALPVLKNLIESRHDLVGVYTQPDKPSGRGKKMNSPAVKLFAKDLGFDVYQPSSLKDPKTCQEISELKPSLIIVAAYGKLIPKELLSIPQYGCWNLHPSLLPEYRGPSPVVSAILDGKTSTGVTLMQMDEGLDTGPIIDQEKLKLNITGSAEEFTEKLFAMGGELLIKNLPNLINGNMILRQQTNSLATTTKLVKKSDGLINWKDTAEHIIRMERAYRNWPGIYTKWKNKTIQILEIKNIKSDQVYESPGKVEKLENKLIVQTAKGGVIISKLKMEGKREVDSLDFISGYPDFINSQLQ
jgi:methionyl-tRNA formyltransferase|tara:strand:+ start:20884 stop:21813 length:930 start_codon:yes stop_codon:yes gene_type:complete